MMIRRAVLSDAEAIWNVHIAAIREVCASAYDAEQIRAWTSRKRPEGYVEPIARHPFFVAALEEAVIGFSELDPESGEICAVYVHPTHLRRGTGGALLQAVEGAARERGLGRVHLRATLNAKPFYLAHGYVLDGTSPVVLGDSTSLLCVDMHKEL